MLKTEVEHDADDALSAEKILEQLDRVVQDRVFRSSKRSIEFLRFVVEQTLQGAAEQIKERTMGVEVFGRAPSYDTNVDHVVRTAAIELRKRLSIYYGEERHRNELRMSLVPGSYIPHFSAPNVQEHHASGHSSGFAEPNPGAGSESRPSTEPELRAMGELAAEVPLTGAAGLGCRGWVSIAGGVLAVLGLTAVLLVRYESRTADEIFWRPVLDTPGPVLVAVGAVPNGPPSAAAASDANSDPNKESSLPTFQVASASTVTIADTVTIANVVGDLEAHGKKVLIRRESSSSFSELREGPAVLIGAFNNEWSLRLTHRLRYALALDAQQHLIYIKNTKNPAGRTWSWATDKPVARQRGAGAPLFQDYALISRIWNSDTGHVVIVIGGLYT